MRSIVSPRGGIGFLLAGVIALSWPPATAAGDFEFLYVNANEGSASGGHAAIKFADEVFHFQHVEPGLLRIYRDDFSAFRFGYGYRENRTIEGHRITVDEAVFQTLRDAFNRRLLIQNRQFALMNAINADLRLLNDLKRIAIDDSAKSNPTSIELKGLGYFFNNYRFVPVNEEHQTQTNGENTPSALLRRAVIAEYGDDFLQRKRQQVWERLQALRPGASDKAVSIAKDSFPPEGFTFAKQYQNLLLNLAALDVLDSGTPLRSEAFLTGDLPSLRLNGEGTAKLTRFRQALCASLMKLLHSERSDWGYPLLVGIARLHALQLSVDTGRLAVLDRFQANDDDKSISIDDENLRAVIEFANSAVTMADNRLSSSEELDEGAYGEIEIRFGTALKIAAARSDQAFHIPPVDNTPSRTAKAELVRLPLSTEELSDYGRQYKARAEAYREQLSALYDYRLLSRNCVTEIFEIINASLARQLAQKPESKDSLPESVRQTSERLLGGYIDDADLNIIPFAAFDQVGNEYKVHSSYRLPPYREQQIEKQYQTNAGLLVDILESNVITSSIYRWHGEDAAFLFFTQDTVWPRPLLGGLNLTTALGQTVYGLFALPWDSGQNLQKSLKGIFVSIPELFFFNIRKGSFPKLIPEVSPINSEFEGLGQLELSTMPD